MCGEQQILIVKEQEQMGSPPRVRGTGAAAIRKLSGQRITPACAGNRDYQTPLTAGTEDHPRVCGEQVTIAGTVPTVDRITPACAGNRDQPRSLGSR